MQYLGNKVMTLVVATSVKVCTIIVKHDIINKTLMAYKVITFFQIALPVAEQTDLWTDKTGYQGVHLIATAQFIFIRFSESLSINMLKCSKVRFYFAFSFRNISR